MSSLERLPADQRAVLQLVLQRGRSYDDIAEMLSIDRAAVRQRALDGFDALGPSNSIPDPQRALVTDYLLGQLPARVAEQVHDRLGSSPPDRAWARVVASEISSLATSPLPEIPVGSNRRAAPAGAPAAPATRLGEEASGTGAIGDAAARPRQRERPPGGGTPRIPRDLGLDEPRASLEPRSSRRGGAILLGLIVLAAVIAIIVVLATGGGTKHHRRSLATGGTPTTSTTGTSTSGAQITAQINMHSPTGGKAIASVFVIREGSSYGVVLKAQNLPANTKTNDYAVWLTNPNGTFELVGYSTTRVGKSGMLQADAPLKSDATKYKTIVVALQSPSQVKKPGPIVLTAPFSVTHG